MKVNIGGKGRIPLINVIAPIRNYDIEYRLATALLRYAVTYPMYESETGIVVNPANIKGLFDSNRKTDITTPQTVIDQHNKQPGSVDETIIEVKSENTDNDTKVPEKQDVVKTEDTVEETIVPPVQIDIEDEEHGDTYTTPEKPEAVDFEELVDEVVSQDDTQSSDSEETETVDDEPVESPVQEQYTGGNNKKKKKNRNNQNNGG